MEFLQSLSEERSVEVQLVLGVGAEKRLLLREGVGLLDYPLLAEQFRFYQEEAGGRDEALRLPEGRMEISQSFVCLLSCLSHV